VNYEGTLNVIEACKVHHCAKLVYSSSPSTRFDGSDVDGLTENQMPTIPQKKYLQVMPTIPYKKTNAFKE
jgi:nucleoside-diphosphate-sugar epimerase